MTKAIVKASPKAKEVLQKIDTLLKSLVAAEDQLDKGWAEFGWLLAEVRKNQYWQPKFESFNDYLSDLKERCNMGRVQLYAYAGTAEKLKENNITFAQMNKMGITKAGLIKEAIANGHRPSATLIEKAIDPEITIQDLRKELHDKKFIGDKPQDGMKWLDLGFYATVEQRKTVVQGLQKVASEDPVVQTEDLLNDPKAIRECILRMAMEVQS